VKPLAYFEARVEKDEATGCWNWKLAVDRDGYGALKDGDLNVRAHRGAWEAVNGPITKGLWACHACDNRRCCNPAHLFIGTNDDNVRDRDSKGRTLKGSDNGHSKMVEHDVSIIKMLLGLGVRNHRLATLFDVSPPTIGDIKHGRTWTHTAAMAVTP